VTSTDIDAEKLSRKAVERGLWSAERARVATLADKIDLVFAPSLSTKDQVTETSGRGVGMDAVKSAIEGIGGRVEISSVKAQGTRIVLALPAGAAGVLSIAA
jgi:two-component system chemotaxis sensor kinase CheA